MAEDFNTLKNALIADNKATADKRLIDQIVEIDKENYK